MKAFFRGAAGASSLSSTAAAARALSAAATAPAPSSSSSSASSPTSSSASSPASSSDPEKKTEGRRAHSTSSASQVLQKQPQRRAPQQQSQHGQKQHQHEQKKHQQQQQKQPATGASPSVFRGPGDIVGGFKIPIDFKSSEAGNADDALKEVKENIFKAIVNSNPYKLLQSVSFARLHRIKLAPSDYMSALVACSEIDDDRNVEAYSIYNSLKIDGDVVPTEAYARLLKVCSLRRDATMALSIVGDYEQNGHALTEPMLCDLLSCLARSDQSRLEDLTAVYDELRRCCREEGWKGSPKVFLDVVERFMEANMTDRVRQVLTDMIELEHQPSPELCSTVLKTSLFHADAPRLLLLAEWYSGTNTPLEHGVLTRMLQVAAVTGDPQLGKFAMQLFSKGGHPPRQADYACWVRSCVNGQDFVGAVEALMEASEQGLDMVNDGEGPEGWKGGNDLQELIATDLSRSVKRLDDVYFALVDLVRGNYFVPRMALNAVIMAAGRMGQIDRSFATFQEASSLFNLSPDVNSFNALLWACSSNRDVDLNTMLSVLQEMEAAGCKANAQSFSLLFQTMANYQDVEGFEEIANLIETEGIQIKSRSLRCVGVALAKSGDWTGVERVTKILTQRQEVPKFWVERIATLKGSAAKSTDNKGQVLADE